MLAANAPLLQDVQFRRLMLQLVHADLTKAFSGYRRMQLCAYFCEDRAKDMREAKRQLEDMLQSACGECWIIFCAFPPYIAETLDEAEDDLAAGLITTADLARRLSSALVQVFVSKVTDAKRDKDYASLRQAIDRATANGQPIFQTKYEKGKGLFFSPEAVVDAIPKAAYPYPPIPSSLSPVDPKIRRESRWDGGLVAKEARRFWSAFVNEYYNGTAGLVPLYVMYYWIRESIALGSGTVLRLDVDGEESANLGANLPSETPNAEEELLCAEEFARAKRDALDFLQLLSVQERSICALYREGMTQEKMAQLMGLKGASSITRHFTRLTRRLREYVTQFGFREAGELFVTTVQDECAKSLAELPTKSARGGV